MSLLFLEGFGAYGTGTHPFGSVDDLLLNWTSWNETPTITEESTAQGRRCYLSAAPGNNQPDMQCRFNPSGGLGTGKTTLVVGMRVYHEGISIALANLCRFEDSGSPGSALGTFNVLPNGTIQYSESATQQQSTTIPTSTRALSAFREHYVELKVTFHNSTGTVDYYIDGVAAGSFTGLDTIGGGTSCDTLLFFYGHTTGRTFQDDGKFRVTDIYVDDATVHGPMEVWYQPADTAGSSSGFTPAASTNESQVDEVDFDADTTYNESTAAATLDQIAHSDSLSIAPLALQPMVMARYVPTGSASIQVGVLSGATHDQESAEGLSDGYEGRKGKIYETDPNTASAWTAANADAAETSYDHAA